MAKPTPITSATKNKNASGDDRSRRAGGGTRSQLYRGKYPPESFVIPGQDQDGNSVREWCRVIPLLDRSMDIIAFSGKFPFKTKGDLMRWCIKVGVDRLEEMESGMGSVTAQVDAMISVLRDEMLNHSFMTLFNTMAATVGAHVQARAVGEARRVVSEIVHMIEKIENAYWRDRYLAEVESKFGYLLKGEGIAGAGLGEHVDGGIDRGGAELAEIDEDDGSDA